MRIPFRRIFEVTCMDIAIDQFDVGHRLCMANLSLPDLVRFQA